MKDQDSLPGAEVNVDGTGYSDEVKRSYQETFFAGHSLKPYKYVGCTLSLWQRLKRIVTNIGGDKAPSVCMSRI